MLWNSVYNDGAGYGEGGEWNLNSARFWDANVWLQHVAFLIRAVDKAHYYYYITGRWWHWWQPRNTSANMELNNNKT